MSKYTIQGETKLNGEISILGAKNGALKALAASILSEEPIVIEKVPIIEDIMRQTEVLESLGAKIKWEKEEHRITVDPSQIKNTKIESEAFGKIRGGMALTGPLLARFGEVTFPEPGGCAFGQRPIDRFLKGFENLGAEVKKKDDYYHIKGKLKGGKIIFTDISVVATETLMMAATLAEGNTTLINAACEPEIPNLANYLNEQGAKIKGAGTHTITIEGVEKLSAGTFQNIPDRIETGFFVIAGVATGGDIKIGDCTPEHTLTTLEILKEMGANIEWDDKSITIKPSRKLISPHKIKTHEYPGLATDQQPFFTTLLTQTNGHTLIHETIYEGRLNTVDSLNKMGANIIVCDPHRIIVNGPSSLIGQNLICLDLRTSVAFLLAGMIAEGETTLTNIYQLERGFENLPDRLNSLSAKIIKQ